MKQLIAKIIRLFFSKRDKTKIPDISDLKFNVVDGDYQVSFKVPMYRQRMKLERWQEQGFNSLKQAIDLGNEACGAACLKMIFSSFQTPNNYRLSVLDIMRQGIKHGAYKREPGWIHKELLEMAKREGLDGYLRNFSPNPSMIAHELQKNHLIIASARFKFERTKQTAINKLFGIKKLGGHLIVVKGITVKSKKLKEVRFNDPSEWGQSHSRIDGESFLRSTTGNIIIIGK